MKKVIISYIALIYISLFFSFSPPLEEHELIREISLYTNEKKLMDLSSNNLALDNFMEVFRVVFFNLDEQVKVYPTENYYYFSFHANGREIWGNIRLPRGKRDEGFLCFAFWEFNNFPQKPDEPDFFSDSKNLGPEDGINILRINPFEYKVEFEGKSVFFLLNQLEQKLPDSIRLRKGEKFLMHTCDESGLQFYLLFNYKSDDFLYILDEINDIHCDFISIQEDFLMEKRTQFIFYDDRENQRKILVAVYSENIKRNNYYDGPFDQLADNYITKETGLKDCLYQAYPYAVGFLDDFGSFSPAAGYDSEVRMAITPYYCFDTMSDLIMFIEDCKLESGDKFYSSLVYDYKKDVQK